MKILITPEANTAETAGSIVRTTAIARAALNKGHEVAFCAGNDINFRNIAGVKNYYSDIPSPIGLPKFAGKTAYKLYKFIGIQKNENVEDYETIFHFIGLSSKRFFSDDVINVRKAIDDFKPNIIFTEHRLSPIVAARMANIKVVTTYSLPIHNSLTNKNYGKYSSGIADFIKEAGLPPIKSVLDLYQWTDAKFIPSTYELEPIQAENMEYVGPLIDFTKVKEMKTEKKIIIVYLGNSGFTRREIYKIITNTFGGTNWDVYVTSKEMTDSKDQNITFAPSFDFNTLLPNTFLFISHGGQNSLMQSLLYGVPMLAFPGGVQERRFNSMILEKTHSGKLLENSDFNTKKLLSAVDEFMTDKSYSANALLLGKSLLNCGGAARIVEVMENLVDKKSITSAVESNSK